MSESVPVSNSGEISLFELFEILWDGKWWLAGFVALALVLAGIFLWYKRACVRIKADLFSGEIALFP